jgi:nickel-dependent lactate racemase
MSKEVDVIQRSLPYGDDFLTIQLPRENLYAYLTPNSVRPCPDPDRELKRTLEHPIGMDKLRVAVAAAKRVLVVADDLTRLTPVDRIIPPVLDELNAGGIADTQVTVMIALGTHRPMTSQEIATRFGDEVLRRVPVVNSPWQDPAQMVDLGTTANGTPIQVARQAVEADFVIGIGSIVPHHIIGYSGGAKIIQPGISGAVTTGATHYLSIRTRHSYLGILENPIRSEMEEIGDRVGLKAILNTVLDRDGNLVEAFFGDPRAALRKGAEVSRRVFGVQVPGKADVVIAGSHPCDIELWQAHKALYAAECVVKDGGTIIAVAPCYEGVSVSHPDIVDYMARSSDVIYQQLEDGSIQNVVAGAVAMAWVRLRERVHITLVSDGVGPDVTRAIGFDYHRTVDEALTAALDRYGPEAKVVVLTHAPDMLPIL